MKLAVLIFIVTLGCSATIGREGGRIATWSMADGFCLEARAGAIGGSIGHCGEMEQTITINTNEVVMTEAPE